MYKTTGNADLAPTTKVLWYVILKLTEEGPNLQSTDISMMV